MTMCEVYCIVIFSFFFFSVFVPRRLPIGMVKELVEITLKKKKREKQSSRLSKRRHHSTFPNVIPPDGKKGPQRN